MILSVTVPFYYAILGFYVGLVVVLSIEGVIIDFKRKRLKSYFHLLFFKVGFWKSTEDFKKVILTLEVSNTTYASRAAQTYLRTRSYNLFLVDSNNDKLLLAEYTDYDKALKLAEIIAKRLNIPFENHFEEMMEGLAERRASMGR
ncbi:MAG: hypothetical protein KDC92_07135 [Bacteroidetes bacterium]|nr:hypothetical protein [Bacteroidota bacterium]